MIKIDVFEQLGRGHHRDNGTNPCDNPPMNPRTMSVRRLVALSMAAVALVVGALAAYAGWRAAGAETAAPWLVGGGAVAVAVVIGLWIVLDRILDQRQFDHRHLPARPEFYDFDLLKQDAIAERFGVPGDTARGAGSM